MRCSDIIEKLEAVSPTKYAEEWDNVGLLAGRRTKRVEHILLALDATDEVVEEAIEKGVDMIVTHHPLIFKPLKRITTDDFLGKRLVTMLQKDICYYAMHTNFDVKGMADAAALKLKLTDTKALMVADVSEDGSDGIGRIGTLQQKLTLEQCAKYVKEAFHIEYVNVYGDLDTMVEHVAICPGSGKSAVKDALAKGADVLVTGDVDHHMGIDLKAQGVCVIDAGHYGIEKLFVPYMKAYLQKELPFIRVDTATEKNPYCTL